MRPLDPKVAERRRRLEAFMAHLKNELEHMTRKERLRKPGTLPTDAEAELKRLASKYAELDFTPEEWRAMEQLMERQPTSTQFWKYFRRARGMNFDRGLR
jgi:hypothetical protein